MITAQTIQMTDEKGNFISPATGIESLFFEQSYNGTTYRTSLNNRLLVTGNNLLQVSKTHITNQAMKALLPLYYVTKINSDTASGLYRLDVSFYSINAAVATCEVVQDLSTQILEVKNECLNYTDNVSVNLEAFKEECASSYLPLRGGTMTGGIKFNKYGAGIVNNEGDLLLGANSLLYLWGSLSDEYSPYGYGIRWEKPTNTDNGKVPVYNYSGSNLQWKTYNQGALNYSVANYNKYYILGITEESYALRENPGDNNAKHMAEEGYIEINVYVSKKNMYANSFYSSSDKALKTDIKTIDSSIYVPLVKQFNWIDSSMLSFGFIAQDLEEHGLLDLIEKDDNNRWRVNYNAAICLVVGDLQKRVNTLEEENKALKKKLSTYSKKFTDIEKRLAALEK